MIRHDYLFIERKNTITKYVFILGCIDSVHTPMRASSLHTPRQPPHTKQTYKTGKKHTSPPTPRNTMDPSNPNNPNNPENMSRSDLIDFLSVIFSFTPYTENIVLVPSQEQDPRRGVKRVDLTAKQSQSYLERFPTMSDENLRRFAIVNRPRIITLGRQRVLRLWDEYEQIVVLTWNANQERTLEILTEIVQEEFPSVLKAIPGQRLRTYNSIVVLMEEITSPSLLISILTKLIERSDDYREEYIRQREQERQAQLAERRALELEEERKQQEIIDNLVRERIEREEAVRQFVPSTVPTGGEGFAPFLDKSQARDTLRAFRNKYMSGPKPRSALSDTGLLKRQALGPAPPSERQVLVTAEHLRPPPLASGSLPSAGDSVADKYNTDNPNEDYRCLKHVQLNDIYSLYKGIAEKLVRNSWIVPQQEQDFYAQLDIPGPLSETTVVTGKLADSVARDVLVQNIFVKTERIREFIIQARLQNFAGTDQHLVTDGAPDAPAEAQQGAYPEGADDDDDDDDDNAGAQGPRSRKLVPRVARIKGYVSKYLADFLASFRGWRLESDKDEMPEEGVLPISALRAILERVLRVEQILQIAATTFQNLDTNTATFFASEFRIGLEQGEINKDVLYIYWQMFPWDPSEVWTAMHIDRKFLRLQEEIPNMVNFTNTGKFVGDAFSPSLQITNPFMHRGILETIVNRVHALVYSSTHGKPSQEFQRTVWQRFLHVYLFRDLYCEAYLLAHRPGDVTVKQIMRKLKYDLYPLVPIKGRGGATNKARREAHEMFHVYEQWGERDDDGSKITPSNPGIAALNYCLGNEFPPKKPFTVFQDDPLVDATVAWSRSWWQMWPEMPVDELPPVRNAAETRAIYTRAGLDPRILRRSPINILMHDPRSRTTFARLVSSRVAKDKDYGCSIEPKTKGKSTPARKTPVGDPREGEEGGAEDEGEGSDEQFERLKPSFRDNMRDPTISDDGRLASLYALQFVELVHNSWNAADFYVTLNRRFFVNDKFSAIFANLTLPILQKRRPTLLAELARRTVEELPFLWNATVRAIGPNAPQKSFFLPLDYMPSQEYMQPPFVTCQVAQDHLHMMIYGRSERDLSGLPDLTADEVNLNTMDPATPAGTPITHNPFQVPEWRNDIMDYGPNGVHANMFNFLIIARTHWQAVIYSLAAFKEINTPAPVLSIAKRRQFYADFDITRIEQQFVYPRLAHKRAMLVEPSVLAQQTDEDIQDVIDTLQDVDAKLAYNQLVFHPGMAFQAYPSMPINDMVWSVPVPWTVWRRFMYFGNKEFLTTSALGFAVPTKGIKNLQPKTGSSAAQFNSLKDTLFDPATRMLLAKETSTNVASFYATGLEGSDFRLVARSWQREDRLRREIRRFMREQQQTLVPPPSLAPAEPEERQEPAVLEQPRQPEQGPPVVPPIATTTNLDSITDLRDDPRIEMPWFVARQTDIGDDIVGLDESMRAFLESQLSSADKERSILGKRSTEEVAAAVLKALSDPSVVREGSPMLEDEDEDDDDADAQQIKRTRLNAKYTAQIIATMSKFNEQQQSVIVDSIAQGARLTPNARGIVLQYRNALVASTGGVLVSLHETLSCLAQA